MRLASRATSLSVNADQSYPPPLLGPAVSFPYRNAYRCYEPTAVVACGERGLPLSRSEAGEILFGAAMFSRGMLLGWYFCVCGGDRALSSFVNVAVFFSGAHHPCFYSHTPTFLLGI